MGFRETWIALRNLPRDQILAPLGLQPTDRSAPGGGPALIEFDSGWSVVVFDSDEPRLAEARELSKSAEVVTVTLSDSVMVSSCSAFSDGQQQWSVTHDFGKGVRSLEVQGEPPEPYEKISARCFANQDAADAKAGIEVDHIYDLPIELGKVLTGYRHDVSSTNGVRIELGDSPEASAARRKNLAIQLADWFRAEGWEEALSGIYYYYRQRVEGEWSVVASVPSKPIRKPRANVAFTPRVGLRHDGLAEAVSTIRFDLAAVAPSLDVPIHKLLGLAGYQVRDRSESEATASDFEEARSHYLAAIDRVAAWCEPEVFRRAFSLTPGHRHSRLIADAYFGWDTYSDDYLAEHGPALGEDFNSRLAAYLHQHPPDPSYQRATNPIVPASDLVTPWSPASS